MSIPTEIYDPSNVHTHCIECGWPLLETPGGMVCTNLDCQDNQVGMADQVVWYDDEDRPSIGRHA